MLIEEAKSISGLSYAELDEALGLSDGQAFRYARYPIDAKTRAPQAGSIQQLENCVAKYLGRPAHNVVAEDNRSIDETDVLNADGLVIGRPDSVDIGDAEDVDLQLGFEGDGPRFRRLKAGDPLGYEPIDSLIKRGASIEGWPEMFVLYAWQWGMLWKRRVPWLTLERYGISDGMSVEDWIAATFISAVNVFRKHQK